MPLGSEESNVKCQFCKVDITTRVVRKSTAYTHYIAMALCLIFFPLVWVPYCCNVSSQWDILLPSDKVSLQVYKIVDHYCPECKRMVGTYAT